MGSVVGLKARLVGFGETQHVEFDPNENVCLLYYRRRTSLGRRRTIRITP